MDEVNNLNNRNKINTSEVGHQKIKLIDIKLNKKK